MKTLQYITIFLALLAVSCTGSKKVAKKAVKLDEAGLYAEAATMYLEAVRRNRNNTDAKIGLKKAGQKLLDDKLGEFFRASNTGQKELAVNSFLDSQRYLKEVAALGVTLNIPAHYQTDFDKVKDAYLLDLYNEGQDLLNEERFKEAELVFSKIGKLDPNFKDAQSLQDVAYLQPLYNKAKVAFDLEHYRTAYEDFSSIVEKDAAFKDAYALREECLIKGRYTIAIPTFKNGSGRRDVANRVSLHALNEMTNINDPFIRVVDRDNVDRILNEQQLALSGVVDATSAIEVGNLLGAQAVLIGEVLRYSEAPGTLSSQRKTGFTSYETEELNSETNEKVKVTKFRRTQYKEFRQEAVAKISVSYKLISMETGEVLFSKVVDEEVSHAVHYAKFNGDATKLYPAKTNGQVNTSTRARKELRRLLRAEQALPTLSDMRNEVVRDVCGGMAYVVRSEIAGRVQ